MSLRPSLARRLGRSAFMSRSQNDAPPFPAVAVSGIKRLAKSREAREALAPPGFRQERCAQVAANGYEGFRLA